MINRKKMAMHALKYRENVRQTILISEFTPLLRIDIFSPDKPISPRNDHAGDGKNDDHL